MLDPGHYGSNYNQSPVCSGYYESARMWKLTMMLKEELEAYGIEVGLTRTNINTDVELVTRGRLAKGYDMFISIHSNAAANSIPSAPWMITLAPDGKTTIDEVSVKLAKQLGPVISSIMNVDKPYYYTRTVDFDRDGNGYIDDEYYGVLFGAKSVGVPALIIEHSFHTNKYAAEWLMSDSNLQLLAKAEARVIANFYGLEYTLMEKKLIERVEELEAKLAKMEHNIATVTPKYNWVTSCPEWATSTIHKLHSQGFLKGNEAGELKLSEDLCRILVILDRAGAF